jgi:TRAP-type C4-dicarboxylate transport system permease small subunit
MLVPNVIIASRPGVTERLVGIMRVFLDRLYLFAGYLAGLFMIALFVLMMVLSGGRPLGINLPAGDDFASWCMAAMAFLALAHTFRSGEMIRVGLLIERLPERMRHGAEIATLLIATTVVLYFAWYGVDLTYDSWRFNEMAQGVVPVPLWIPQLGYAAGLIILAIAFVDELVHVATGHAPRYEKEKPKTAEELLQRVQAGEL